MAVLCTTFLAGCCPGGIDVLESLTLPVDQQVGCSLVPGQQVVDGSGGHTVPNPTSTSDSRVVSAVARIVAGSGPGAASAVLRASDAYAAVYECEPGGPAVRVYAVVFREPSGPERVTTLDLNPAGVMHKGQLAGVVLAEDGACRPCYDAVRSRAQGVLGK